MTTERCLPLPTFLMWKLPLIITLTTLSFECFNASEECNDIAGPFRFRTNIAVSPYMIVHEGDYVTINCSTTVCNATVSLLVDGRRISQSSQFDETLQRDGNTFSFIASRGQDAALLQCHAKLQNDVIQSDTVELTIKPGEQVEQVTILPNITEVTLEKGDNFEVACQANGYGTAEISYINWYLQNATGKYLLQNPMVVRESTPGYDKETLKIQNADFGVQGTYICERQVPNGPITAAWFQLTFKEPKIPLVRVSPSSLKSKEASSAITVICVAIGGSPKPSIGWYKDGVQLKSCQKGLSCPLIIEDPKYPDDDGHFTCIATNSEGSNSSFVNIQIVVPPTIARAASSSHDFGIVVDVDQKAELTCTVERANPSPKFSWFRLAGNQWSEEFEKIRVVPNTSISTTTSTLVVPPSKSTALFRCRASNEAGYDSENITVHWKGREEAIGSMAVQRKILAIVVSLSIILILFVLLLAYGYKRRLLKRYGPYLQTNLHFEFDSDLLLKEQSHKMPYDPKWEFPRDKIFLLEPIGKGAFGEVWLAKAQGILEFRARAICMSPIKKKRFSRMFSFISDYSNIETVNDTELSKVAVKTLKADATQSEYKDLASELKILIHVGEHQNIVNLLGACSKSGKLCVILEYCPYGDLSSFLRSKRDIFQPSWQRAEDGFNSVCTYFDLANFTYQIARGMDFLASKKCVHRDLAARNILVSKDHNDAFVVKIADFGMSRDIYRDEVYVKQSSGVLPLKWTAPESIVDAIYTSQSDVWSYGIVLWEIFTLGGSPYPGVSTDEFLGFLRSNKRMEQPESCPDEFYSLMVDCWEEEPDMRPVFSKIYERIRNIIEEFADINATYLRLESLPSPESKKQSTSEYVNSESGAEKDLESRDTIKISINSCEGSTGSDEEGYENISSLKKLIEERSRSEYVDMLNNDPSDENDNVFHSQRDHILL